MKWTTTKKRMFFIISFFILYGFPGNSIIAQVNISIDWDKVIATSKTTPTLQVVYNPMLKRGSPIHNGSFEALKNLGADYVRFVPWFPYPHAAVAELRPPTKDSTFWDFSQIDPVMEDLMNATQGHSTIINFSTIPVWMFKTDKTVEYPKDPDQVFWNYNEGTELRDTTFKELADYFVRLFQWYTKGGFTDELGHFHKSGYYYKIPYWEVLNEPDLEHRISPQLYTRIYDEVVLALKAVSPETRFIGLALATENSPEMFEYFLNPANHKSGVPLDGISYHFYAGPSPQVSSISGWQYSFFEQADNFLTKVRYIESIRRRLSPLTFTDLDELGIINENKNQDGKNLEGIPTYWNLAGAMYAYLFVKSSLMGIDVAGESQLVGYPTQFPSVSMMNWKNGKPNARYWVLKLLKENFESGDKLIQTNYNSGDILAQAFLTFNGKKLLLINKRDKEVEFTIPQEFINQSITYVDPSTGDDKYKQVSLKNNKIKIAPFSVAVIK